MRVLGSGFLRRREIASVGRGIFTELVIVCGRNRAMVCYSMELDGKYGLEGAFGFDHL